MRLEKAAQNAGNGSQPGGGFYLTGARKYALTLETLDTLFPQHASRSSGFAVDPEALSKIDPYERNRFLNSQVN